jgi:glutamate--cysteine ligase catalytic subunit
MQAAQKRDAARSGKFYFRKDVYPRDGSLSSSGSSSSGQFSPPKNSMHKQKKLGNCFTPPGPPVNGELQVPVEDEYELMTMDGIINGKVRFNGGTYHIPI